MRNAATNPELDEDWPPTKRALAVEFLRIGLLSFGGPAAQIAMMHQMLVVDRHWISEHRYLTALSYCNLLPGPEATQLATYVGWRVQGVTGGLIAGGLFVLPGAALMTLLAAAYVSLGGSFIADGLFTGLQAAVLVIIAGALIRMAKMVVAEPVLLMIAGLVFLALFLVAAPYPLVIVGALVAGFFLPHHAPRPATAPTTPNKSAASNISTLSTGPAAPHDLRRSVSVMILWLALWLLPLIGLTVAWPGSIFADIGWFFAKLAVVSVGGAYSVLAYMAQDAVTLHGWLTPDQMMDGLGLAETTPGPLILVTQFVGFITGAKQYGILGGCAGAAITLWATFMPCFLWIFVGAPYIDWISSQPRLATMLMAIRAAIVGVILNLSLWFGLHVLFAEVATVYFGPLVLLIPDGASINYEVLALAGGAGILMFGFGLSMVWTLLSAACAGALIALI